MSDFNSCDFGAITPELVLQSLISGITGKPNCGLRIVDVSLGGAPVTHPATCASINDFWSLILRSLVIATDGKVAIHTITTASMDGAGLENCVECGGTATMQEYGGSLFSEDEAGNVYLNLINVST